MESLKRYQESRRMVAVELPRGLAARLWAASQKSGMTMEEILSGAMDLLPLAECDRLRAAA